MLSVKKRQQYMKELGFYTGIIDGIVGLKTKAAYLALQKAYFKRKDDIDGYYGNDTDTLLQNAYNVAKNCKNFRLTEFKCKCGQKYCTGYPAILDPQFLKNLQAVRDKFGKTDISSGLRCSRHNVVVGGSAGSRHKLGKAVDIRTKTSNSLRGRQEIMSFWKTLPLQRYTYCNVNGNYPNMGTAVHIDIK